ncbi:MAG TPA: T9SS type A sorting domain-containing protein, partial [Niastella sp.]
MNAVPAHLEQGDLLGDCPNDARIATASTVINAEPAVATLFPNPAHNTATIAFELISNEKVSVTVVNIDGKIVYQQPDKTFNTGKQQIKL